MTYLPKPSEGGDFTPPPAGTYAAVCYGIVDLGTQDTTFAGEAKQQRKVLLSWELHDEDTRMKDGRYMSVHERYTWSTHEKSNLRKQLEAWRGRKFSDSDFGPGGFDVRKLLGVPCMLSIVHNDRPGGKTYANVASISKPLKGMSVGELQNDTRFLWLDEGEFDEDVFNKLSDGIKNTIRKSPEYHELQRRGSGAETKAAGKLLDDEVPF